LDRARALALKMVELAQQFQQYRQRGVSKNLEAYNAMDLLAYRYYTVLHAYELELFTVSNFNQLIHIPEELIKLRIMPDAFFPNQYMIGKGFIRSGVYSLFNTPIASSK